MRYKYLFSTRLIVFIDINNRNCMKKQNNHWPNLLIFKYVYVNTLILDN